MNTGSLLRFLNERDSHGRTALHYYSENNHRTIVEEIFTSSILTTGVEIHYSAYDAMSNAASEVNKGCHNWLVEESELKSHSQNSIQRQQFCAEKSGFRLNLVRKRQSVEEDSCTLVPTNEQLDCAIGLAQDSKGLLPIHLAAQKAHREVVSLLLRCAPSTLYIADAEGLTPFHYAARGGHLQIVEDWMAQYFPKSDSEDKVVERFMELFRITTRYEVAVFLLKELDQRLQSSSLNRRAVTSLLHWAIMSPGYNGILIPQILKWQPGLANEILDYAMKHIPIHVSTISGRLDMVETLCREEGWLLRANQKDKFNKTALDVAYDLGHKDICEHLMQRSDVKDFLSRLQDEQNACVIAANAILVVAVLIAGASLASCVKPLGTLAQTPFVISSVTFMTSITATILGACAALPFSLGLYIGKQVKRHDYIGYKVRRIRLHVVE